MLRWSSEGHLAPLPLGPSWCSPFRLPPEPLILLPGAQHPRALAQHCCPCAPSHHSFASLDRSCRRLSLGQLCSLKSTRAPRTRSVPALPPILREPLPFRRPGTPDPAFPMPRGPLPTPRPSFQITQHSLCSSLPAGICSFGHLRGRGQSGCAGRCPHSNRDSVRGGDSSSPTVQPGGPVSVSGLEEEPLRPGPACAQVRTLPSSVGRCSPGFCGSLWAEPRAKMWLPCPAAALYPHFGQDLRLSLGTLHERPFSPEPLMQVACG